MSAIRILPDEISNRIAAGEVIERPASIVKELMENSVDSGADKISVTIEGAGVKLVSVSDNGCGMDPDDALLCLEPHATSKISSADDLNSIRTFGFRGEALPSIASVSRIRIRTRTKEMLEGTEVVAEGGSVYSAKPVGCAPGTEISVRDLFYNTPARKKFLHSRSTEEFHIQEVFCATALANRKVSFVLNVDGVEVFGSPAAASLSPRIRTFYGKGMEENLIPVAHEQSGIKIEGFIARHGFTKTSRREQRVFVNGRPIESPAVYAGIKNAYGSLIPPGRFPPVVLFLLLDPARADINVHPAKREIRFREPGLVTAAVAEAVRETLRVSQTPTVFVDSSLSLKSVLDSAVVNYVPKGSPHHGAGDLDFMLQQPPISIQQKKIAGMVKTASSLEAADAPSTEEPSLPEESQLQDKASDFSEAFNVTVLAFLDDTYILASSANGLLVIDQHAAHERILFERILSAAKTGEGASQKLLIPVTLELSPAETAFVKKNTEPFEKLGFEIEIFGNSTIVLNSIPEAFSQDNVGGLFTDMVTALVEQGRAGQKINEAAIARAACKNAVKSHDRLSRPEAEEIIRQLSRCELPFSCPHGRPTIINISFQELEKRFGRRK